MYLRHEVEKYKMYLHKATIMHLVTGPSKQKGANRNGRRKQCNFCRCWLTITKRKIFKTIVHVTILIHHAI